MIWVQIVKIKKLEIVYINIQVLLLNGCKRKKIAEIVKIVLISQTKNVLLNILLKAKMIKNADMVKNAKILLKTIVFTSILKQKKSKNQI